VISDVTEVSNNRGINTPTSTTTPPHENPRLSILSYLKDDISPAKIWRKMGIPESTFQYHFSILKKQGLIRKLGYGTWEVIDQPDSAKKRTVGLSRVGTPQDPHFRGSSRGSPAVLTQTQLQQFQQDSVRAHAFVFTLQVQRNLRNWNNKKREQFLNAHNIPFKSLNIGGGGQRIIVKDRKVWLLNKSIIIYDKSSYFAEDALRAKGTAIATHLSIIKHIERLLHVEFRIGDDYKFKVSRQHYALIQNALAKQYNEAGEKLEVRNGRGLWFLIDNSFSMNEAETVHSSSAMSDNLKVQGYFNGLKEIPATHGSPTYTPAFVLEVMNGIQQNQMAFAENMTSHIDAVKSLGSGVKDMTAAIERLKQ
jgi:DNA-binding transcriptional ArsR family regulator